MTMNSLLEEMQLLVDKINEGTATMGEIEAFAAAAQDLNERAIIIRYKAYELKVQPTQVEVQATVEEQVSTNVGTKRLRRLSQNSSSDCSVCGSEYQYKHILQSCTLCRSQSTYHTDC